MEMLLPMSLSLYLFFFFSSRRRHTRLQGDWSSDVCSSDLESQPWQIWEALFQSTLLWHLKKAVPIHYKPIPPVFEFAQSSGSKRNAFGFRSEERRVGKECRSRWSPYH